MGKLNKIQDKINAKMKTSLADVTFPFTANRQESVDPYDPDNPQFTDVTYSGDGIFGLQFTKKDSDIFQIEVNDMKAILFMRYITGVPKPEDKITWRDGEFTIIDLNIIPADNGWVLQLRKV